MLHGHVNFFAFFVFHDVFVIISSRNVRLNKKRIHTFYFQHIVQSFFLLISQTVELLYVR